MWSTWGLNHKFMYTYYYDYLGRNYIDDFFINNYYYFWTSFWYIPTLILLLLVFYVYTRDFRLSILYKVLVSTSILFLYEVLDYWLMSIKEYDLFICSDNINILLLNSINKYHPLVFYYSALLSAVFSSIILYFNIYTCRIVFAGGSLMYKIADYISFNFILINFTLFLGSWWALQEGSWGGWWNWDPSEVFGMVIMLFIIVSMHYYSRGNFGNSYRYSFMSYFILSLLLYIFIQLNFNLVSHNFGIRGSQFVNTVQFFSLIFLVLILKSVSFIKSFNLSLKYFIIGMGTGVVRVFLLGQKSTMYIFYSCLTFLIILLSFYPLINDFLWKLNSASVLNIPINFPNLVTFIIIYTYLAFFMYMPYYLMVFIYSSILGISYMSIVPILYTVGFVGAIHTGVLMILVYNFINYNKVLVTWSFGVMSNYVDCLGSIKYSYNTVPSTLNNTLELRNLIYENFNICSNSIVTYTESTSPDNNLMYLISSGPYLLQVLIGGFFYNTFYINVIDSSVQLVYFLWLVSSSLFIFLFRKNIPIIF